MNETLHWFKSSYSDSGGGNCVEVAFDEGAAPAPSTSVTPRSVTGPRSS